MNAIMTRLLIALSIATGMQAQLDPMELLRETQAKVTRSVERLPRYMCTQTIDRLQQAIDSLRSTRNCEREPKPENIHITTSDRLRIVHPDGVSDNRTVFSACHEFLGESTVRFDPPPSFSTSPALPTATVVIPAGSRFQVELTQGFDSQRRPPAIQSRPS